MKLLGSSPAARIFTSGRSHPLQADDDRLESRRGPPPHPSVRRWTPPSLVLFDPLRIAREAPWIRSTAPLKREQREASRGPGGGNEPPGRRHEVGEIRQGGPQPRPLASPLIRTGRSATDRRTNESRAPTKTTRRSRRQGISCPHVEASKVPTRSREQSPCVPALRRPPPVSDDPSRAPAAGGFAVSPAPRAGTTFYPCRSYP